MDSLFNNEDFADFMMEEDNNDYLYEEKLDSNLLDSVMNKPEFLHADSDEILQINYI